MSESPRRGETGARRCGGGEVKRATQGLGRLCGCLKRRVGRGRWPWRNNFLGISNCWADWFWIHLLHQLWKVTLINQLLCPCQSGHLTRTHINRSNFGSQEKSIFWNFWHKSCKSCTQLHIHKEMNSCPPPRCLVKAFESRVSVNYRNQLQFFSRRGPSQPGVPAVVKLWTAGGDLNLDQRYKVGSGDISYTSKYFIYWAVPNMYFNLYWQCKVRRRESPSYTCISYFWILWILQSTDQGVTGKILLYLHPTY